MPAAGAAVPTPPLLLVTAGGVIYTGSPNLSVAGQYFVPATGGQLKIPLTTPLVWNGSANNLVLEFCYDNSAIFGASDQSYYTQTLGCRTTYVLSYLTGGVPAGCALQSNSGGALLRYSSDNRPNITFKFHRIYNKFPISIGGPGHWINNGTFLAGNSIVTFNGTSTQNITGTSATTFHELAINNSSHVRQTIGTTVDDTLWLTNGHMILNQNTLTLNNNSPGAITRTNGYIRSEDLPPAYGQLRWKMGNNLLPHNIPFATIGATSIPFIIDPSAGTSDLTISTYPTVPANTPLPTGVSNINAYYGGLPNGVNMVDRYYVMNNTGVGPVADMTFSWTAAEAAGVAPPPILAQRWDVTATTPPGYPFSIGPQWWPASAPQTPGVNSVMVPTQSVFNLAWTFTTQPQPLPVSLLNFTAKPMGNKVKLEWTTASEFNNDYFTIERTRDIHSYDFIDQVRSYGNSSSNQYYSTIDNNPYKGLQYYRLKQTDLNGAAKYSDHVPVAFNLAAAALEIITVVNNENNTFTAVFSYNSNEPYAYQVVDMMGRIVSEGTGHAVTGTNLLNINTKLSEGIYTLVIRNTQESASRKIVR